MDEAKNSREFTGREDGEAGVFSFSRKRRNMEKHPVKVDLYRKTFPMAHSKERFSTSDLTATLR